MKNNAIFLLAALSSILFANAQNEDYSKVDGTILVPKPQTRLNELTTTKQRGLIVFNDDLGFPQFYDGTQYRNFDGAGQDGNDFLIGATLLGETISFNIPNQTDPVLDLSVFALDSDLLNYARFDVANWDLTDVNQFIWDDPSTPLNGGGSMLFTSNAVVTSMQNPSLNSTGLDLTLSSGSSVNGPSLTLNLYADGSGNPQTRIFSMDEAFDNDNDVVRKQELDAAVLAGQDGTGTDDQTANEVPFTPYRTVTSVDIQNALQELKDELDAIMANGTGIVAEGIFTITDDTDRQHTITHSLGFAPASTRIMIFEIDRPNGELVSTTANPPAITNITSTTFDFYGAQASGHQYAWAIFGTDSSTPIVGSEIVSAIDTELGPDWKTGGGSASYSPPVSLSLNGLSDFTITSANVFSGASKVINEVTDGTSITVTLADTDNTSIDYIDFDLTGSSGAIIVNYVDPDGANQIATLTGGDGEMVFKETGNGTAQFRLTPGRNVSVSQPITALYDGQNVIDPNNENAVITGITGTDQTITASTEQSTNGTHSVKVVKDIAGFTNGYIDTQNIASGQTIVFTLDVYRVGSSQGNLRIFLDDGEGWSTDTYFQIGSVANDDQWTTGVTVTATATQDNPRIRLYHLGSTIGDTYYLDNLVYTVQ